MAMHRTLLSFAIALSLAAMSAFAFAQSTSPPEMRAGSALAPHPTAWYPSPTESQWREEQSLDRRLPVVDLQGTPLQNVLDVLWQRSGLRITVDWDAIGPIGITPQSPVTYRARDIEVRHVLAGICEVLRPDGELIVGRDPLRITSRELYGRRSGDVTRFYPVGDIVEYAARWDRLRGRMVFVRDDQTGAISPIAATHRALCSLAARSLMSTLVNAIEPDCWEINGGTSTITMYGPTVIIRSTREVHSQTADLLRSIREAIAVTPLPRAEPARQSRAKSGAEEVAAYRRIHTPIYMPHASETRFEAALAARLPNADDGELTFERAVQRLQTTTGIPIFVDWDFLKESGIARDKRIATPQPDLSAGHYIAAVLQSAGGGVIPLACVIRPTGLRIIAREAIRSSTRVYPADDLVLAHAAWLRRNVHAGDEPGEQPAPDLDDEDWYFDEGAVEMIATAITQTVTPDAWEINGGVGTLSFLGPILVVRQSFERDGDPIQEFLDGLAESLDDGPARGATKPE